LERHACGLHSINEVTKHPCELCLIVDFKIFLIWELREVKSGNLGIQLNNYTITRVMKKHYDSQTGLGTMFKEEASKGCY
jgi:hypothetical protein